MKVRRTGGLRFSPARRTLVFGRCDSRSPGGDLSVDYELTSLVSRSRLSYDVRDHRSGEGERGACRRNSIDKSPKKNVLARTRARFREKPREKSVFDTAVLIMCTGDGSAAVIRDVSPVKFASGRSRSKRERKRETPFLLRETHHLALAGSISPATRCHVASERAISQNRRFAEIFLRSKHFSKTWSAGAVDRRINHA